MPFNLIKNYPQLLELLHFNQYERRNSLQNIFNRDFVDSGILRFQGKPVRPTTVEGEIPMQTLFSHLTTTKVNEETNAREFELERSVRLHWVKFHIEERKKEEVLIFSSKESNKIRTYIYDTKEKYVVILEPFRKTADYYLLTAYFLKGRNDKKMRNKYKRRLSEVL